MAGTQWTSKRRALVISTFTLAFAAFLRVAAPQLVPTAELLAVTGNAPRRRSC